MLNFPVNPSVNDTYTYGDTTWVWSGAGWNYAEPTVAITGDLFGTLTDNVQVVNLTLPSIVSAGSYSNLTVDSKGRVTNARAVSLNDITTALGAAPVTSAGSIVNGNLVVNGFLNLANTGVAANSAVNNEYVLNRLPPWLRTGFDLASINADAGTSSSVPVSIIDAGEASATFNAGTDITLDGGISGRNNGII